MKIVDIADELYRELDTPSGLSIPSIAFWLRTNIGDLNTKINKSYEVDSTTYEITPDIGDQEKDIFKRMYRVYFFDREVRKNLGAAAIDSVLEVTSDGATVRLTNRNEISKTYSGQKRLELEELKSAIKAYKLNGATPRQVVGDDSIASDVKPKDFARE